MSCEDLNLANNYKDESTSSHMADRGTGRTYSVIIRMACLVHIRVILLLLLAMQHIGGLRSPQLPVSYARWIELEHALAQLVCRVEVA